MTTFRILTIAAVTAAVFSGSSLPVFAKSTSHEVSSPKAAIKPQPLPPRTPPKAQINPQPLPPISGRQANRF